MKSFRHHFECLMHSEPKLHVGIIILKQACLNSQINNVLNLLVFLYCSCFVCLFSVFWFRLVLLSPFLNLHTIYRRSCKRPAGSNNIYHVIEFYHAFWLWWSILLIVGFASLAGLFVWRHSRIFPQANISNALSNLHFVIITILSMTAARGRLQTLNWNYLYLMKCMNWYTYTDKHYQSWPCLFLSSAITSVFL